MNEHTTNTSTDEIPYGYCHCGCGQKTKISISNDRRRGWVKGEPRRFISGHNGYLRPLEVRFWENIDKRGPHDCWEWKASKFKTGYGRVGIGQSTGKTALAHRVAYEFTYGPIPNEMVICHKCDNPPCCNPSHLFLGSHADNVSDKVAKNRHDHGMNHACAKLTDEQVVEARLRYATGNFFQRELAAEYCISRGVMGALLRRKTWRHLP